MEKIYSLVNSDVLLHMVVRRSDIHSGREDLIPENQFLQCSTINMRQGTTFRPHQHVWKDGPKTIIAQESWVVIHGSVRCTLYDIDGAILAEPILYPGDASFTLQGGHNYLALEAETIVYEYKTGPYEGQQKDKVFL